MKEKMNNIITSLLFYVRFHTYIFNRRVSRGKTRLFKYNYCIVRWLFFKPDDFVAMAINDYCKLAYIKAGDKGGRSLVGTKDYEIW